MSYRCEFLTEKHLPEIHRTFCEAFSDYQIAMGDYPLERLRGRLAKNAVAYELSVGAFDDDRMVGFTLLGVDRYGGALSAFDAGTGIVKEHRGAGLARRMFDHALPALKERGVKRVLLEVLQENIPAIKAYEKAGFRKTREFDCFLLKRDEFTPGRRVDDSIQIRPISDKQLWNEFTESLTWEPSWENSFASIARIQDDLVQIGAFVEEQCAGMLVYYPVMNWVLSLLTKPDYRRRGIATRLLSSFLEALPQDMTEVKLNNVDCSDQEMLDFLAHRGFTCYVSQFEMALEL